MRSSQNKLLLLVALFATASLALSSESTQAKCPYIDPRVTLCTQETKAGCVCYTNGKCEYRTDGNKCNWCIKKNVVSFDEGKKCPLSNPPPTNQPKKCPYLDPAVTTCPVEKKAGCVCYKNGKCEYRTDGNQCLWCIKSNVASFDEGKKCSLGGGNPPPSKPPVFTPKKCPYLDPAVTRCTYETKAGCVCYKNGKCEYRTDGNQCTWCIKSNVASFNEGQKCPGLGGGSPSPSPSPRPQCNQPNAYKCQYRDRFAQYCTQQISTYGCVCYKDGTCKSGGTNKCSACKNPNVVSVYEGKSCPKTCN